MIWHLGLPVALFAYVWLRDKDRTKAAAPTRTALVAICSVAGVLALVSCSCGSPPRETSSCHRAGWSGPVWSTSPAQVSSPWLSCSHTIDMRCRARVLWVFQRSVLDQWLMVVVLASIIELVVTALFGGSLPFRSWLLYRPRIFARHLNSRFGGSARRNNQTIRRCCPRKYAASVVKPLRLCPARSSCRG